MHQLPRALALLAGHGTAIVTAINIGWTVMQDGSLPRDLSAAAIGVCGFAALGSLIGATLAYTALTQADRYTANFRLAEAASAIALILQVVIIGTSFVRISDAAAVAPATAVPTPELSPSAPARPPG